MMVNLRRAFGGLILLVLGLMPGPLCAGALSGRVVEAGGGPAVVGASVELPSLRLGVFTGNFGEFRFSSVPPGPVSLLVRRAGYRPVELALVLTAADTSLSAIALEPAPIQMPPVEVRSESNLHDPYQGQRSVDLRGERLRESLARSIAETIAEEPGLSQRTLGPSPARPVLRGLGGDRLPVLEDGLGTGDLSVTADDHAVTIEAAASRAIEVIRGPATLELGSNVLAGVVNVRRDYVPEHVPDRLHGSLSVQGESASNGLVGSGFMAIPLSRWALSAQGVARRAEDLATPAGTLTNTELRASDVSVGGARIWDAGRAGGSYADYRSRYGIPGGFMGGHTKGVDIDLERQRAEFLVEAGAPAREGSRAELGMLFTRYYHRELESQDIPSVSFGLLTYEANARYRWSSRGALGPGVAGFTGEYRDFQSGFLNFTPPTIEHAGAAYLIQSWESGSWRAQGALRFDVRQVTPAGRDTNKAGVIRPRHFGGGSGGLQLEWQAPRGVSLDASLMRTFLAPSVEHLFAEGPHLAAYAYEIGNADLDPEVGLGLNVGAQLVSGASRLRVSVFRNSFARYLYAANTGQLEVGPGAEGFLARYRYAGAPVVMNGGELDVVWSLAGPWSLEGNASAVRGTLRDSGQPLPSMPPLHGRIGLAWQQTGWVVRLMARGAAAQNRLGEFEQPTAGYVALSSSMSWSPPLRTRQVSLNITGDNLLDAEYRDHLSRIKSIMPEAGRSVRASVLVAL